MNGSVAELLQTNSKENEIKSDYVDYKSDYNLVTDESLLQQEAQALVTKMTKNTSLGKKIEPAGDTKSSQSKTNDYWRTPNTNEQPILTMVSAVLDGIGLDATSDDAKSVPAGSHFTQADSCLDKSWNGLGPVFMNPPFSKLLPFVEKLVQEYKAGYIPEAITLLKAGTLHNKGTGSLIWSSASAVCHWGCGKALRIA